MNFFFSSQSPVNHRKSFTCYYKTKHHQHELIPNAVINVRRETLGDGLAVLRNGKRNVSVHIENKQTVPNVHVENCEAGGAANDRASIERNAEYVIEIDLAEKRKKSASMKTYSVGSCWCLKPIGYDTDKQTNKKKWQKHKHEKQIGLLHTK